VKKLKIMKRFKKSLSVLIAVTMIVWSLGVPLATLLPVANAAVTSSRLSGADRYATAVAISLEMYPAGTASAVLATGENYPDALAGVELADYVGGPLLLTQKNSLTTATKDELASLAATTVYLLGGTSAISSSVETTLSGLGYTVTRLSGADRYATAVEIAKQAYTASSVTTAFVATGLNFPDALAAAGAARANSAPLLLVKENSIPSATANYLATLTSLSNIYVIGGTAVVSSSVATSLGSYGTVTRVSGANRYATATEVAKQFYTASSLTEVITATGENFPDALAGGVLSAKNGVPIVLAKANSLPSETSTYLNTCSNVTSSYILGGTAVVSDSVVSSVASAIGGAVPGAGVSVTLSASTPAAANIIQGSANNEYTKIDFKAGSDAATVTSITVTATGSARDGNLDLASIKLYDGGDMLGMSQVLSNWKVTFTGLSIDIAANTTKTLTIQANINAAGVITSNASLGINAAADIGGVTASGSFPVVGKYMTIVAGNIGALTADRHASAPATGGNLTAGDTDKIMAKWLFSEVSSNEDVTIDKISLRQTQTAVDSDLANLKLYAGTDLTNPIGTATLTNDVAAFTLTTPVNIAKGMTEAITLKGDVVAGSGRLVFFSVFNADYIEATGDSSGVGITTAAGVLPGAFPVDGTAAGANWLINPGNLTVAVNSQTPTGNVVVSTSYQDMAKFDLTATGEQIRVTQIVINVATSAGTPITNVSRLALYDGEAIVGTSMPTTAAATVTFANLNWMLQPSTTPTVLTVKAIAIATGAGNTVTLSIQANNVTYDTVTTNTIGNTVPGAAQTAAARPILANGVLAVSGVTSVPVTPVPNGLEDSQTAVPFLDFDVQATNEDINLDTVLITATSLSGAGAFSNANNILANAKLYDITDGSETLIAGPVQFAVATGIATFDNTVPLFGAGIEIPKGTAPTKTLRVKADVRSTAPTNYAAGTFAAAADLDVGLNTAPIPLGGKVLGFADLANPGVYDAGEPVYLATAIPGNVLATDIRITPATFAGVTYPAGSIAVAGDNDLGQAMTAVAGIVDPEYIDLDASGTYTPGDLAYDDVDTGSDVDALTELRLTGVPVTVHLDIANVLANIQGTGKLSGATPINGGSLVTGQTMTVNSTRLIVTMLPSVDDANLDGKLDSRTMNSEIARMKLTASSGGGIITVTAMQIEDFMSHFANGLAHTWQIVNASTTTVYGQIDLAAGIAAGRLDFTGAYGTGSIPSWLANIPVPDGGSVTLSIRGDVTTTAALPNGYPVGTTLRLGLNRTAPYYIVAQNNAANPAPVSASVDTSVDEWPLRGDQLLMP